MNNNETKEIIKVGIILFAITFVAAFLLGFTNIITKDRIAEQSQIKLNDALGEIFPGDIAISELEAPDIEAVIAVYEVQKNGEKARYCINTVSNGFGGEISILTGIDAEGQIVKVQILSMSETAGLGTKAGEAVFLDAYNARRGPFEVEKNKKTKENGIVAISGATITSEAVTKGVNAALEVYKILP